MIRQWMIIFLAGLIFCGICPDICTAQSQSLKSSDSKPTSIRVDSCNFPVLYYGEPRLVGDAVWMVQARLKEIGFDIIPNGIYDETTSENVKIFQTANRLIADGVVTQSVWECLMYDSESEPCITGAATDTANKMRIEIDLVKHRLTVFKDQEVIKEYAVGVGKSRTPSPLGEWKVVHKGVGWGNGFGTRWMGLNVPWGIYGIHGTDKPYSIGASMSHGCIRMQNRDVEELYPLIQVGTPVKIMENGQIFPKNFSGRTLRKKSSGQNVVYLQSRLKEKGIIFDRADGRFGDMTELAVKYYQVWHDLEPTGIADEATYRSLGMIE